MRRDLIIALAGLGLSLHMGLAAAGTVTPHFVDHFSYDGAPRPPWVVKNAAAQVSGGRLHLQSTTSPRDTLVTAFDDSLALTDYRFSALIDPVEGLSHTWAVMVFRAQNFFASDLGASGNAYELLFSDNIGTVARPLRGNGQADFVELYKFQNGVSTRLFAQFVPWLGSAFTATIAGRGGHLTASVNGQGILDLTDPHPILAGGIGLRTIWEAATAFDDARISPVPLPPAAAAGITALGALALLRRRSRRAGAARA